jgi:PqqD family protein of HPr-rel-A system
MRRSGGTADPASVRPAPNVAVETAFLAPEAVLFDDRHGEIHHLNPSASAVWLLLDGEQSIAEIAAELSDIFGVPEPEVLPDVEKIVADFRRRGLLAGADRPESDTHADHEVPQRIDTLVRPPDP